MPDHCAVFDSYHLQTSGNHISGIAASAGEQSFVVDILIDFVVNHLDESVSVFHNRLCFVSNTKIQQLFETTKFFYTFLQKKLTIKKIVNFRNPQSSDFLETLKLFQITFTSVEDVLVLIKPSRRLLYLICYLPSIWDFEFSGEKFRIFLEDEIYVPVWFHSPVVSSFAIVSGNDFLGTFLIRVI